VWETCISRRIRHADEFCRLEESLRTEVSLTKQQPSPIQRAAPARGSPPLVLDVTDVGRPDIETIDALCRVALEARRSGCPVRLQAASSELRELVAFSGLASVLRS
jgi:ABC-type transporter Mla MlaB component